MKQITTSLADVESMRRFCGTPITASAGTATNFEGCAKADYASRDELS